MSKKSIYTEEELKERIKERSRKYYQTHKTEITEKHNEYNKTPMGRAHSLLQAYNQSDKKAGRGKGDLTSKWIVDNIFTQPCAHCGKTGWDVIGCNRLDNSKPHTMDNVEPCCPECNNKLTDRFSDETKQKMSDIAKVNSTKRNRNGLGQFTS